MFNVGKKDEQGRQRRIEHRGRFLRASRTGGVALRAQTKAAGVNLTANTSQGVRVSTSVGKRTQVALQNGRFILRGRYGAGPLRFNLSKSGVSLSAKNQFGSFNLTNPNRSSAKVAGIQLRGSKAANLQLVYLAVTVVFQLVKFAVVALVFIARILWWAFGVFLQGLASFPTGVRVFGRAVRNWAIRHRMNRERGRLAQIPEEEKSLVASLTLVYGGWGRGYAAGVFAEDEELAEPERSVANELDSAFNGIPSSQRTMEAVTAHLAQSLRRQVEPETLPEILLTIDDRALKYGPRTRRQARLLEVVVDFASLRMEAQVPAEVEGSTGENLGADTKDDVSKKHGPTDQGGLDINTADAETLVTLPGISEVRAREIQEHRPFTTLDDLEAISGIGPTTVQRLREAEVRCG